MFAVAVNIDAPLPLLRGNLLLMGQIDTGEY